MVTGTLASGSIRPGDTLEVLPRGPRARVRSIQVHGQAREAAEAGERTSLQLTGIALEELERGMQLGAPEAFAATTSLFARFTLLPDAPAPIRGFMPVRVHLYASEVLGRMRPLAEGGLAPGETGPVEIRLQAPVVGRPGGPLHRAPPLPRRHARRRRDPRSALAPAPGRHPRPGADRARRGTSTPPSPSGRWKPASAASRPRPSPAGWARRPPEAAKALRRLAKANRLIEVPEGPGHAERWIAPSAVQRVTERARRVLKEYFQKDRLAESMPKAEAVRRILRGRAADLAPVYFGWLEAQKVLSVNGRPGDPAGAQRPAHGRGVEALHRRAGALRPGRAHAAVAGRGRA